MKLISVEYIRPTVYLYIKLIYSEKAAKFCEIFPLPLTVSTAVKSKGKISQNFAAFSEYMNFNIILQNIEYWSYPDAKSKFKVWKYFYVGTILPKIHATLIPRYANQAHYEMRRQQKLFFSFVVRDVSENRQSTLLILIR